MNVKTMTLTVCALLLGAAAGYFAPGKGGEGMKQDAPQETRCASAIADNGAQASIKALRARVAELEKQLAAKPADEKAPAPDSGPSRFVESHVERMKKMAVDDPQRYAQITNRIANWRRRRSEQARSRIDFLSSIDTSRMSAEAREVHEELQQLVARREELEEDLHRHGLDDTKRHGLFQELREIGTKMRELNAKERDNLLSETARNLGFEGSDAAEIVTTVKEVFNATESGWGMPGFGPGGRGPRPRAR
jgi:hypothetical protein